MGSILRNPDHWKWFSEDLEARRGILLRLKVIRDMIGHIGSGMQELWIYDRLNSFRYTGRGSGTEGNEVAHLVEAGTKVLEDRKGLGMV